MQAIVVRELPEVIEYLQKHQLGAQYKKAKEYLQIGHGAKLDFRLRQPKSQETYQFRINQKYRAFGAFRETSEGRVFIVYEISDHQY